MADTERPDISRHEYGPGAGRTAPTTVARYECWGCGDTFTFRALKGIEWEGQPCPNRCGNVLSPAG